MTVCLSFICSYSFTPLAVPPAGFLFVWVSVFKQQRSDVSKLISGFWRFAPMTFQKSLRHRHRDLKFENLTAMAQAQVTNFCQNKLQKSLRHKRCNYEK